MEISIPPTNVRKPALRPISMEKYRFWVLKTDKSIRKPVFRTFTAETDTLNEIYDPDLPINGFMAVGIVSVYGNR